MYPADNYVAQIFDDLISASSDLKNSDLGSNIFLRKAPIENFASMYVNDTNFIVYDEAMYKQFEKIKGLDVSYMIKFSLAHELGHFINQDVGKGKKAKKAETSADRYACGLLMHFGDVSQEKLRNAILYLASAAESVDYPSKGDRLAFLDSFYESHTVTKSVVAPSKIAAKSDTIEMQMAFTPNGDGLNDIFFARGDFEKLKNFEIYDRWGQLVFKTNDRNKGWDGTYKGEPQDMGVYVWSIEGSLNGGQFKKTGNMTLIR